MRAALEVVPKLGAKLGMPALRIGGVATYDRPIEHLAGQLDVIDLKLPLRAKDGRYGRVLCLALGGPLRGGLRVAARLRTTAERSASTASATAVTATITPAGTVTATAITGTIVPDLGTIPPNPTPAPSLTPSPAPGCLTQAQLKYRLIDQFGRLLFCDPDYYPVARGDEQALAHQRLPDIQKDAPTFSAILSHLGIAPSATYTSEQELAIYRDWKMLNALRLEPVSAGFHFIAIFSSAPSTQQGSRIDGTIDQRGAITVASRTPSGPPPCPICLARGTRIAT